jgi:environmental stress-induced protein Ves
VSWNLVCLDNVAPSPWRNGGGVTRELVAHPKGENWIWRMSVAEVESGGPFSRFDGVRRWFTVLSGAGVRLRLGEQPDAPTQVLTRDSAPFCFDGAWSMDCQLLDGATQDFNLMVRPDKASAEMTRVAQGGVFVLSAPKTVALYAMGGSASISTGNDVLTVPGRTLAWRSFPAGTQVKLTAADALWMEIESWA